MVNNNDVVTRL